MSIISALQSATIRLVGTRPTAFFSATRGIEAELSNLSNEVAADIVKAHDWRVLTKLYSMAGDGSATEFDLPDDYDRMAKKTNVWSTAWQGMYFDRATDLDEWYYNQQFSNSGAPGWWIILGGKFNIYPAPANGSDAQFYYVSNNFGTDNAGDPIAAFTQDDDNFVLPDRLLTLGLIWRWRAQKRLEYAEDMANYEKALSEFISEDKGSRVLREPSSRGLNVRLAYPGNLG